MALKLKMNGIILKLSTFPPATLLAMATILASVLLIQLGTRPAKEQAADKAAGRLVENEA